MSKLFLDKNVKFGVIPHSILYSKELSLRAKGLWVYLQSKPDNWTFSVPRIQQALKEGRDAVSATLQELEEFGLLRRAKVKNGKNQWGGVDYYLSDFQGTAPPSTGERVDGVPVRHSNKDNSKKGNSKKEDISCPNAASPPSDQRDSSDLGLPKKMVVADFETFWAEYPRKEGKGAARKKFLTLERRLFAKILDAIDDCKKTEQWQDRKYIPMPVTWLNQGRWEDEVEVIDDGERLRRIAIKMVKEQIALNPDKGENIAFFRFISKYKIPNEELGKYREIFPECL